MSLTLRKNWGFHFSFKISVLSAFCFISKSVSWRKQRHLIKFLWLNTILLTPLVTHFLKTDHRKEGMKQKSAFLTHIYIYPWILHAKEQNHLHFSCSLNFTTGGLRDSHWCIVQVEKLRWEIHSSCSALGKTRDSDGDLHSQGSACCAQTHLNSHVDVWVTRSTSSTLGRTGFCSRAWAQIFGLGPHPWCFGS